MGCEREQVREPVLPDVALAGHLKHGLDAGLEVSGRSDLDDEMQFLIARRRPAVRYALRERGVFAGTQHDRFVADTRRELTGEYFEALIGFAMDVHRWNAASRPCPELGSGGPAGGLRGRHKPAAALARDRVFGDFAWFRHGSRLSLRWSRCGERSVQGAAARIGEI